MKKQMAGAIAGAAFLVAAGGAAAAEHDLSLGSKESFMDVGAAMGEVCTADKNTIQYMTEFFVSSDDLQIKGIEGGAFVEQQAQRLSSIMKNIWSDIASGYKLSELQSDPVKLDELGNKLNAAQKEAFDKFEAETGVTVMTNTSATGARQGCAP